MDVLSSVNAVLTGVCLFVHLVIFGTIILFWIDAKAHLIRGKERVLELIVRIEEQNRELRALSLLLEQTRMESRQILAINNERLYAAMRSPGSTINNNDHRVTFGDDAQVTDTALNQGAGTLKKKRNE